MWFSKITNCERSRDSGITVYLKHILIQAFEHFQVSVLKPLIKHFNNFLDENNINKPLKTF